MSWFDLLILNISILDLIIYPVLIVLVVFILISLWRINKSVKELQYKMNNYCKSVDEAHTSVNDLVTRVNKLCGYSITVVEPQQDEIPLLGSISNLDGEVSCVTQHTDKGLTEECMVQTSSVKPPHPKKQSRTVYTPDPATPDISYEDARQHIIENVTGPVAEAVKKLPQNWTLESLKQDKKLKNQLFVLLKAFQHSNDEQGKKVAKKLYLLLNPKASES